MMNSSGPRFNRRSLLKSSVALLAGGAVSPIAEAEPEIKNANTRFGPIEPEDYRHALRGHREAGTEPVRADSH